jgi:hypothetical protein
MTTAFSPAILISCFLGWTTLANPTAAGPTSYICTISGYHVTEDREDWAEMMKKWTIAVDRRTGSTIHPSLGNTSYNYFTLLNSGSDSYSFREIADSGHGGSVKYMTVEEYAETAEKPFVVIDNGDTYWGKCF